MIPVVQERLQKILARAGFASRRGAEELMEQGRVTVNGDPVREPGTKADAATDDIRVDGVRVKAPSALVYLVLNKPRGVVTTRRDPAGRQTVMDLVPGVAGLFPVGRLDVTTEGLILLTNDGAFAERVAHPRYEVPRVYHAKVHRAPDVRALERLHRGVTVEGDLLKADRVRVLGGGQNPWLELTLHEGKQHEVRRLLEAVGHPVSKLRRVAIGPVVAKGLEVGHFRALSPEEVAGLLRGESAMPTPARSPQRTNPGARRSGPLPARPRGQRGHRARPGPPAGRERAQGRGERGGKGEQEGWARRARRGGRARPQWSGRGAGEREEEDRGNQVPQERGSGRTRRGSRDQQDWTTASARRDQGSGRGVGRSSSTGGRGGGSRSGASRDGRSGSAGARGRGLGRGRQGMSRGGGGGTGGHGHVGGGRSRGRRGGRGGRR
jgi:23S rRNA pseudouridine2605 synthase